MQAGFSLLELSIVLVIIGLLAGGVMTGQSLIRATELRAATTEYQRFLTATHAFRDKYQAVPGDFGNATAFWGKDNTNCTGNTGTAATPGTCNGNSDGALAWAGGANATGEIFQFWKQLGLAGLIEGSYSGLSSNGSGISTVSGINAPASKVANGGWFADTNNSPSTSFGAFFSGITYGNYLMLGLPVTSYSPYDPLIKPEEAWNIDTKIDDGKPSYGRIIPYQWSGCTTAANYADTASPAYRLTNGAAACTLMFLKAF